MIQRLFAMYDMRAETFGTPLPYRGEVEAKRAILNTCRTAPDLYWVQSPSDFKLCALGEFDDETGELRGYDPIITVIQLRDLLGEGMLRNGEPPVKPVAFVDKKSEG